LPQLRLSNWYRLHSILLALGFIMNVALSIRFTNNLYPASWELKPIAGQANISLIRLHIVPAMWAIQVVESYYRTGPITQKQIIFKRCPVIINLRKRGGSIDDAINLQDMIGKFTTK